MLRNLALSALTAITIGTGFAVPAQAGTCWYLKPGQVSSPEYCRTVRRINYNGHIVFDITDGVGQNFTVVLWDDNIAEVIGLTPRPQQVRTYTDSDGDTRLVFSNGEEFVFIHS